MSWVAVAVAGVGLLKAVAVDGPAAERKRKLEAEKARYGHLTGLQPGDVKEADPIGSAVAFGTTGLGIKQGMENAESANKLSKAKTEFYQSQTPITSKTKPVAGAPTQGKQVASRQANPWTWDQGRSDAVTYADAPQKSDGPAAGPVKGGPLAQNLNDEEDEYKVLRRTTPYAYWNPWTGMES